MNLVTMLTLLFLAVTVNLRLAQASPWQRSADQRTLPPEKVDKGRQDWGFDLGLGYSQYSGNIEQTSASLDTTYFKKFERDSFYLNSGFIYGLSKGVVNQNQGKLVARYDWQVTEQFRWFAFNTHSYNEFLKLNYRGTLGVGPWYDFIGDGWKNGVSLAPAYFYENFAGYGIEKDLWYSFRNFYTLKLNESTDVGFDFFYMIRANEVEDHLIFFQPFLETAIKPDKLSLKLSYIMEGDSRPKPGVKSTDFNYYATVVIKFGD